MKQKKKTPVTVSFILIFVALCLSLGVYTLIRPARDFSPRENRKLAKMPSFSLSSFADGDFQNGFTTFFNDQFAGRDMWAIINLGFKRALGQSENSGVIIGKNGQLYLIPEKPDGEAVKRNLDAVESFGKEFENVNSYFCLAPNAVTVQTGNLPRNAPTGDLSGLMKTVSDSLGSAEFIDVTKALESKSDEYIYYLTDHHWTSLGAKIAFEEIADKMQLETGNADYKAVTVAESFNGTLSSKSGCFDSSDRVEIYLPEPSVPYTVEYDGKNEKLTTIFNLDALESNDKYTVFFGGNHPRIDIRTAAGTDRHLLVFKDSYFNSLCQFLLPYFDTITVIDARYYYDYAGYIVSQQNITDILYLYNADTFGTDASLYAVLEKPAEAVQTSE
jgi:hypothetical protein